MSADHDRDREALLEIHREIDREDRTALARARVGLGIRLGLLLLVLLYMTWLSGVIGHLGAPELTRLAAARIEERLPELRTEIRDYAIDRAPEITDQARELLLEMPAQLRGTLEGVLRTEADAWSGRLEEEVDAALIAVMEEHLARVRESMGDAPQAEQLERLLMSAGESSRLAMIAALDRTYEGRGGLQRLNAYLGRLQRGGDLSEAEELDRELIEIWMLLVQPGTSGGPFRLAGAGG